MRKAAWMVPQREHALLLAAQAGAAELGQQVGGWSWRWVGMGLASDAMGGHGGGGTQCPQWTDCGPRARHATATPPPPPLPPILLSAFTHARRWRLRRSVTRRRKACRRRGRRWAGPRQAGRRPRCGSVDEMPCRPAPPHQVSLPPCRACTRVHAHASSAPTPPPPPPPSPPTAPALPCAHVPCAMCTRASTRLPSIARHRMPPHASTPLHTQAQLAGSAGRMCAQKPLVYRIASTRPHAEATSALTKHAPQLAFTSHQSTRPFTACIHTLSHLSHALLALQAALALPPR